MPVYDHHGYNYECQGKLKDKEMNVNGDWQERSKNLNRLT